MTYKVESSPAKALNWSWTQASPLATKRHHSDTDQSDTDEVFEKNEGSPGLVSMFEEEVTEAMEVTNNQKAVLAEIFQKRKNFSVW